MKGYVFCWGLHICHEVDTVYGQVDKVPGKGIRQ